jgi:hypothetical protein
MSFNPWMFVAWSCASIAAALGYSAWRLAGENVELRKQNAGLRASRDAALELVGVRRETPEPAPLDALDPAGLERYRDKLEAVGLLEVWRKPATALGFQDADHAARVGARFAQQDELEQPVL